MATLTFNVPKHLEEKVACMFPAANRSGTGLSFNSPTPEPKPLTVNLNKPPLSGAPVMNFEPEDKDRPTTNAIQPMRLPIPSMQF